MTTSYTSVELVKVLVILDMFKTFSRSAKSRSSTDKNCQSVRGASLLYSCNTRV